MVAYQVVAENLRDWEIGDYTAFGVCAYCIEASVEEKIAHVSDVFLNTEEAQQFVEACNRLQLDTIHLPEAIEDALQNVC